VLIIVIVLAMMILIGQGVALSHAHMEASPPTTTSRFGSTTVTTAYADDFSDPGSGWHVGRLGSSTTLGYVGHHYVVNAHESLHHLSFAPFQEPINRFRATAVATQVAGAPLGAGFGLLCYQGVGTDRFAYEFLLLRSRQWFVERRSGSGLTSRPLILRRGTAPADADATPASVQGTCDTEADGRTTRLQLRINGHLVSSLTDAGELPGDGWLGGIVVSSRAEAPSLVSFDRFQIDRIG